MNLRLLCCFLILLSGPTWSKDSNPGSKREKLNLYPGLRLTYVEGDDIKTRVFGYTFLTEYSHQLREDIQFDFAAR